MFHYRLFFKKESGGAVLGSEDIVARDDVDAVRLASAHVGQDALELWCDKRKVKAFPPIDRDRAPLAL